MIIAAYHVRVFDCPECERRHELAHVRSVSIGALWTCCFCGLRLRITGSSSSGFGCENEGKDR